MDGQAQRYPPGPHVPLSVVGRRTQRDKGSCSVSKTERKDAGLLL